MGIRRFPPRGEISVGRTEQRHSVDVVAAATIIMLIYAVVILCIFFFMLPQELDELDLLSEDVREGGDAVGEGEVRVPALLQMAANQVQQDSSLTKVRFSFSLI